MFVCHFCDHRTEFLANHLTHLKVHSNLCRQFLCGFNGCKFLYQKESHLKMHLITKHSLSLRQTSYDKMSEALVKQNCMFTCSVGICMKKILNYQEFSKHLKTHIRNNEDVRCPFPICNKIYTNVSSFTSHISRHKTSCNIVPVVRSQNEENYPSSTIFSDVEQLPFLRNYEDNMDNITIESFSVTQNDQENYHLNEKFHELFKINLGQLYLKLESQFLVPVSTIQFLIKELENIDSQCLNILKSRLTEHLILLNPNCDKVNYIINGIIKDNPMENCKLTLATDHKRKQFYKETFAYVQPESVSLGKIKGKKAHYHYVPIIDSIKAMFQSKEYNLDLEYPTNDTDVLKDFFDGELFKSNPFF